MCRARTVQRYEWGGGRGGGWGMFSEYLGEIVTCWATKAGELLSITRKHDSCILVLTKEQTNQPVNQKKISWNRVLIEKTRSSSVSQEILHIL